jgi:hypothetical protein
VNSKYGKALQITKRFSLLASLFTILLVVSCASRSNVKTSSKDRNAEFALLAPGGVVYLYIDVPGTRPVLDRISFEGIQGSQGAQILDRTTSAVAAFYPEGMPRRFLAAVQGRYPSFQAKLSFTLSPSWKKRRSETGASYWHAVKNGVSVSLGSSSALISDGDPFVQPPGVETPEGFEEFCRGTVMAGWMEDASGPLNNFLASMEIPLQIPAKQVFFSLYTSGQEYETVIQIETPSVSQAKALVTLFSMARLFMANAEASLGVVAVLFANPPVQDGPYLRLHTGSLDAQGIALLFTMFSLYSINKN